MFHILYKLEKQCYNKDMEKLTFTDGDKIGVFDGQKTTLLESEYILRYREYALERTKNDEWKFGGEGARFRGDYDVYRSRQEKVYAYINGVQWEEGKVVYSFTVNNSSGVYRKDTLDLKAREEHILSSSDEEILSLHKGGNVYAVTIRRSDVTSSIGTLDSVTSELKTLTDGDSRDANPYISPLDSSVVYFDSAGVGRTSDGEFTGKYAPSAICTLNLDTMEIKEVLRDEKWSFVKPKLAQNGDLYCIKRPTKEKRGGNPLVEMLLIPVRIFQAIVMFVQFFVIAFTGKSLTSDGDNPTKGREQNSRKLYVDGNLIEAEKELKRNKKTKDKEYGFIPASWKLVKISGGKEETVKSGICDFALCKDGGLYCTNGRHIFYIKDGKTEKVVDTDSCLCVATESVSGAPSDVFSL